MLENIILSFRGIWSHKLRSFLTMLGVIIGIASIITIVSIVEGTNRQLEKSLIGAGNNVVSVAVYEEGGWQLEFDGGVPAGLKTVSEEQLQRLRNLEDVENATAYLTREWGEAFCVDHQISGVNITGITDSYLDTFQYYIKTGRGITAEEFESGKKVMLADAAFCDAAFGGENPIGQVVELGGEPFVMVGVTADRNASEKEYESINDYYMYGYSSSRGSVYIPVACWPLAYQFDEPQTVGLRASSTDKMQSVGMQAQEILAENSYNESYSYRAVNAGESADDLKTLTNAIQLMLVSIAGLSLLVGGIGVMNIMLVSVTERTGEIGLKKALGAKRRSILAQFLTEAAVLTGVGGVIGVVLGMALARLVAFVIELPFGVNVGWILISVAFSLVIGLVFGAMPAARASKLRPIDALRHE